MWWPQRQLRSPRGVAGAARRRSSRSARSGRIERSRTFPVASQVAASIVYTVLGNLDQPDRAIAHVTRLRQARTDVDWKGAGRWLRRLWSRPGDPAHVRGIRSDRHSPIALGAAWLLVVQLLVTAGDNILADVIRRPLLRALVRRLRALVPGHIDTILGPFVSTGKDGAPAIQEFCDRGFMGLPLDNQMDDVLMPTWFTELWVPFTPGDGRVQETIARLRRSFDADGSARGAYAATGPFAFELYAARRDDTFFLSPATGQSRVSRRRVLVRQQPGQSGDRFLSSILGRARAARLPAALGQVPAVARCGATRSTDRSVSALGQMERGPRTRQSDRCIFDALLAGPSRAGCVRLSQACPELSVESR